MKRRAGKIGKMVLSPYHKHWETLYLTAKRDLKFVHLAYKKLHEEKYKDLGPPGDNYSLILRTDELVDTKDFAFQCEVYKDFKDNQFILSFAGTRMGWHRDCWYDLVDDFRLMIGELPHKFKQVKILNDMIMDSLGLDARSNKFHYTGHSLGAVLAELAALDLKMRLSAKNLYNKHIKQITATSFENYGAREIASKMLAAMNKSKEEIKHIFENLDFITINARPSVLNSNPQIGTKYTILAEKAEVNSSDTQQRNKLMSQLLPKLKAVGDMIIPTSLVPKLIQNHRLKHFEEILQEKKGEIQDEEENIISFDYELGLRNLFGSGDFED